MITRPIINRAIANKLWMELCQTKGTCWLPVLTESMLPLIRPGDRVKVSRIAPSEVHFGDIAVFCRGNDLIVHRILKTWHKPNDVYFSEKGDAGLRYTLIKSDDIIGRVIGLKRGTRTFDLNLPPSRMVNLFISAWFRVSTACVNRLTLKIPAIFRAETVLRKTTDIATGFLAAGCLAIWYTAGRFTGNEIASNGSEDE